MSLELTQSVSCFLEKYIPAKKQEFAGNPVGSFIRDKIPSLIYSTNIVDRHRFLIKGSVGQGQWATVPWICIFNQSITTTATKGVYIVYLLSSDGNSLYLTFNQGCTDIRNNHTKKESTFCINRLYFLFLLSVFKFNKYPLDTGHAGTVRDTCHIIVINSLPLTTKVFPYHPNQDRGQ